MNLSVSIVIPLHNAQETIAKTVRAIFEQECDTPLEVLVVNDGSTDQSVNGINEFLLSGKITLINQENKGAVIATNRGFSAATGEIVCSIDSDVVIHRDWLRKVLNELEDPKVAAVQGYYKTPKGVSFLARMAGYDMERRLDDIKGKHVTQVNSGTTAYRKSALERIGLFDPHFKYAYDNDLSYRLIEAGFMLILRKDALSDHYWKSDLKSYIKQQFWTGYGRMQVIKKHKGKITGDTTSGLQMILQVPFTLLILVLSLAGIILYCFSANPNMLLISAVLLGISFFERLLFAVIVFRKQKDPSVIFMPFVHFVRNVVWSWAFLKWSIDSNIKRK